MDSESVGEEEKFFSNVDKKSNHQIIKKIEPTNVRDNFESIFKSFQGHQMPCYQ